jgi:putative DNA primase/helicase
MGAYRGYLGTDDVHSVRFGGQREKHLFEYAYALAGGLRCGNAYGNLYEAERGTRLVTTTEAEQGKRLSEPLIKQITGNDALTARFLYGEFFNFVPTFKIFMVTNHKPTIKGTDYGIWRRIKLIPFTTTIEEERQDKHLEQKLMEEGLSCCKQ